jgi:hypothetical protein
VPNGNQTLRARQIAPNGCNWIRKRVRHWAPKTRGFDIVRAWTLSCLPGGAWFWVRRQCSARRSCWPAAPARARPARRRPRPSPRIRPGCWTALPGARPAPTTNGFARWDGALDRRAVAARRTRAAGPADRGADRRHEYRAHAAARDGLRARGAAQGAEAMADDEAKKAALHDYQLELNRLGREAVTRQLLRALYSPKQLQEQMTWFWSNHFQRAPEQAHDPRHARRLRAPAARPRAGAVSRPAGRQRAPSGHARLPGQRAKRASTMSTRTTLANCSSCTPWAWTAAIRSATCRNWRAC